MKTYPMAVVLASVCILPAVGFSEDTLAQTVKYTATVATPAPVETYTSTGILRVSRQSPYILFPPAHWDSEQEFDAFKKTQAELVTTPYVMLSALRKPASAKLPAVQAGQKRGNVVRWLQNLIKVDFPGDAELMNISVTTDDPQTSAVLARVVVDAYLTEIVNMERDHRRQRLSELDRAYIEKETEIRSKLEDMKKLAETLGVSDSETRPLKQKIDLEELRMFREERKQLHNELRPMKNDLAAQKAALQDAPEGSRPPMLAEIKRLEAMIAATTEELSAVVQNYDRCRKEIEKAGISSVDIEMMRAEIKNSYAVFKEIETERSRLRIEVRATPRITLLQRPDEPETKD